MGAQKLYIASIYHGARDVQLLSAHSRLFVNCAPEGRRPAEGPKLRRFLPGGAGVGMSFSSSGLITITMTMTMTITTITITITRMLDCVSVEYKPYKYK